MRQSIVWMLMISGLMATTVWAQDDSLIEGDFRELIRPTNGLWWNPDEPGTGLSLEFSKEGPWFGSMYLYNQDGSPTFVTLQGETVAYSVDRTGLSDNTVMAGAFTLGVYAVAEGSVNRSSDGLCLNCSPQTPITDSIGATAVLEFFDLDRAQITIRDQVSGEIILQQALEPFVPGTSMNNPDQSTYAQADVAITLLGNGFAEQDSARQVDGGLRLYFTGQSGMSFQCADDCSETALSIISQLDTFCMFNVCHGLAYINPIGRDAFGYHTFISHKRGRLIGVMPDSLATQLGLPTQIIIGNPYD